MQLGALSSLVEVGVGLNLAFGVVQQFRERLSGHLRAVTLGAASRIQIDLQRALARLEVHDDGSLAKANSDAEKILEEFEAFTGRHQGKFVVLAVVASVLLIGALPVLAWHGTYPCDGYWLWATTLCAVGPVGLWGGTLIGRYGMARGSLWWLRREHERDIRAYAKLFKVSVHPKEPRNGR